jgi:AraC-type transcriptional regulator N-terminus
MRNMRNASTERESRRMQADREELAERIARAMPREGTIEAEPGLHFRRCSRSTERLHAFCAPAFCVIAQGRKELVLGEERFQYGPEQDPHASVLRRGQRGYRVTEFPW